MPLALNNPRRLICHYSWNMNKKQKINQQEVTKGRRSVFKITLGT